MGAAPDGRRSANWVVFPIGTPEVSVRYVQSVERRAFVLWSLVTEGDLWTCWHCAIGNERAWAGMLAASSPRLGGVLAVSSSAEAARSGSRASAHWEKGRCGARFVHKWAALTMPADLGCPGVHKRHSVTCRGVGSCRRLANGERWLATGGQRAPSRTVSVR